MTKADWLALARAVLPAVAAITAAFLAARPLLLASRAERDMKLINLFVVELLGRTQARAADREVGVAEQNAVIMAVAVMGTRYPDVLLEPALAGVRTIDQTYSAEDKAKLAESLPEALRRLEYAAGNSN